MITPLVEIGSRDVAGHYDELDEYYRRLWGDDVHHGLWRTGRESPAEAVRQLTVEVADAADIRAGERVCDVGCGYGGTSRYLATERDAEVTGLTLSRAQRDYAVNNSQGLRVEFLLRDWLDNQLPPDSFDKLVSIECISHMEDKAKYFEEVRRVLKPGGRAAVTAWLTCESPTPQQTDRLLEPICREGRLPSMGSQTEYTELIESAGLRLLEFRDWSPQVARTWQICGRRLMRLLLTSPSAWWFLLRGGSRHAVFLRTVGRIRRAYGCGAMRYGLFVIERTQPPR